MGMYPGMCACSHPPAALGGPEAAHRTGAHHVLLAQVGVEVGTT